MPDDPNSPPRVPAQTFLIPERRAFLDALDLERPELAAVKTALDSGDVSAAATAFAERVRERDMSSPLLRDWSAVPRDPAFRDPIAEDCLNGKLWDGYNVYEIPETGIDWYECPLYCLVRFPVFPALLASWHHTQDPRYLRFIIDHTLEYMEAYPIEDFIGKHSSEGYRDHYTVGPVTWWCLLPNRLDEWAAALAALRQSPLVTDEEIVTSMHRTLQEIRFLMTQVPYWLGLRHNVVGFMIRVIGILCRVFEDFTEADEWRERNARWQAEYLEHAFYPDGLFKELTLGYSSSVVSQQFLIAEVQRHTDALATHKDRIRQMAAAMIGLTQPDGRLPSFGDALSRPLRTVLSSPSLLRWTDEPWLAALAEASDSGTADADAPPAWMPATPDTGHPKPPFTLWPAVDDDAWGGYYAMRSDWSQQARYLMIDGGPWGTTHQHMDRLSFVLSACGANFITDPGNTLYANNEPGARITMLNAGFLHNTITIDGVDECVGDQPWWETERPLTNRWETGDGWVLFVGEFDFRPFKAVTWQRRVLFVDNCYWIVQDALNGEVDEAVVEQNFQFEPDIDLVVRPDRTVATAPNGARLCVQPLATPLEAQRVIGEEEGQLTYSTQYESFSGPKMFDLGRGWISRVTNCPVPAPALLFSGLLSTVKCNGRDLPVYASSGVLRLRILRGRRLSLAAI